MKLLRSCLGSDWSTESPVGVATVRVTSIRTRKEQGDKKNSRPGKESFETVLCRSTTAQGAFRFRPSWRTPSHFVVHDPGHGLWWTEERVRSIIILNISFWHNDLIITKCTYLLLYGETSRRRSLSSLWQANRKGRPSSMRTSFSTGKVFVLKEDLTWNVEGSHAKQISQSDW